MPLQVVCPGCSAKLKAPDTAAGKKTKCPKCQAVISVPVDAPQAPAGSPGASKKSENWYMQTTDGSQYGPVPRSELDEWFKEGRISADCQLLKEGADQWQWATEVYPSLEQPAAAATPSKPTGFDFLGPATSTNDPLGLGNTALGTPLPNSPMPSFPGAAPSFPANASAFGGAPAYGGGGYGPPSGNPYSSPSSASYGSSRRSGLHPMVIIAGILEFLGGAVYMLGALGAGVMMIVFIVGGASVAASVPADAEGAEAAGPLIAMFSGLGVLCMLPFAIIFLCLSILMIYTGIGLFKRKFWAKIVAIILAILHLMPNLLYFFLGLLNFDPCSIFASLVGVAINAVILVAMFLPDGTSDFQ